MHVRAHAARRGGTRDLHRHLQQALRARRARRLRHFARTALHGASSASRATTISARRTCCNKLLAGALATGLYDQHVAKIEKRYAQKARVMKQALAEHFPPNVEIWESGGGLYFWARLPKRRFHRREIKSFPDRAEKRRALRSRRTLLRRRSGAAQTGPRNAHQLRQRERGKHPRRHQAAGQGVEEICLTRSDARTHSGVKSLGPVGISTTSISSSLHRFCTDDATTVLQAQFGLRQRAYYTDRQSKRDTSYIEVARDLLFVAIHFNFHSYITAIFIFQQNINPIASWKLIKFTLNSAKSRFVQSF